MRITRNNDPLNLIVYDKFVLKILGFSEWLKIHALVSKVKTKANDLLLKNLKAKFQWLKTQAEKLGVPPLPHLTTVGLSAAEKKRKRTSEIIKEVFVSEDIVVDGMHRNLVPPSGVEGSRGLVITQLINTQSVITRDTSEGEMASESQPSTFLIKYHRGGVFVRDPLLYEYEILSEIPDVDLVSLGLAGFINQLKTECTGSVKSIFYLVSGLDSEFDLNEQNNDRKGQVNHCTLCSASEHNQRSCPSKGLDDSAIGVNPPPMSARGEKRSAKGGKTPSVSSRPSSRSVGFEMSTPTSPIPGVRLRGGVYIRGNSPIKVASFESRGRGLMTVNGKVVKSRGRGDGSKSKMYLDGIRPIGYGVSWDPVDEETMPGGEDKEHMDDQDQMEEEEPVQRRTSERLKMKTFGRKLTLGPGLTDDNFNRLVVMISPLLLYYIMDEWELVVMGTPTSYYRAIGERWRKERVLEYKRRSSRKYTKSEEYDVSF
ncbi:hypothetical protein Tco_0764329 [Tanacetum coccineum]